MAQLTRRRWLQQGLAAAALVTSPAVLRAQTLVAGVAPAPSRLVVVLLRGALDGLTAVPPIGDPDYARLRRQIAVAPAGSVGGVLPLQGDFGLHPALTFMAERWQAGQLNVLHAVATPYRERSHFDGQDVLESGYSRAHAVQSGWLNRALLQLPGVRARESGVALGTTLPLIMRGPAAVAAWAPSTLAALDEDTLQRIADLYAGDAVLARRLADALATDAIATQALAEDAAEDPPITGTATSATARYFETVKAAAGFLRQPEGPRVAVLDTTGWDTHANEGGAQGVLAQRLGVLDSGLRRLSETLGPVWDHTVVLVATEFGRTAAINGTGGTDHGTASAAFLLGGAVRGGRVLTDWPGLGAQALYEGRDLRPTSDLRAVCKTVLRDHLGVPQRHIETQVFPDSARVGYIEELLRPRSA